jgi:hypothetical protein
MVRNAGTKTLGRMQSYQIDMDTCLPTFTSEVAVDALTKNPSAEWPTPYVMKTPRLLPRRTEVSVVIQKRTPASDSQRDRVRVTISRY